MCPEVKITTLALYHDVVRRLDAAGITEAETDASVLLCHVLGCRRSDLFLHGARWVAEDQRHAIALAVDRRLVREPLAYILGEQEFYGRAFVVTPEVLIPRPETELLVERALTLLQGREAPRILDLGVGSGVIAISLALELPTAFVVGLDISLSAVRVAHQNAIRHGVADRILWLNSNWVATLRDGLGFDLLAANPPYVARKIQHTLQPELAAEPDQALYGGDDGRADIDCIMADATRLLRPGGVLLMEIGFDQGEYVTDKMQSTLQFDQVMVHRDYADLPRILQARRLI